MKRTIILLAFCIAASCTHEEPHEDAVPQGEYVYAPVQLRLTESADESKSMISIGAENFKCAKLYAFDHKSSNLIQYGSNAGTLEGEYAVMETSEKSFSFPLPLEYRNGIDILCFVNDYAGMSLPESPTLSQLSGWMYRCSIGDLSGKSSTGLPMSGKAENLIFTEEDSTMEIRIRYIFAKYSIGLDLSSLPAGASVKVDRMQMMNANTIVPWLGDGYCQQFSSLLSSGDCATDAQLASLSKGGSGNAVDLYVLENCHGTHEGASSWRSVWNDLHENWDEIDLCTHVQMNYTVSTGDGTQSGVCKVYLGEGDMKSDFNVRRNLYKPIMVRIADDMGPISFSYGSETPYWTANSSYTIGYSSNIYEQSGGSVTPEFWFTDGEGNEVADRFEVTAHDPSAHSVSIRVKASCAEGETYRIYGGLKEEYTFEGFKSAYAPQASFKKEITVNRTLSFPSPEPSYPYLETFFISDERFTEDVASALAASLEITELEGSVNGVPQTGTTETADGWAVSVSIIPTRPGSISFSATYGGDGKTLESGTVTILEPVLKAYAGGSEADEIHLDVTGSSEYIVWKLCSADGTQLENPAVSGNRLTFSKKDSYGTDLRISYVDHDSSDYTETAYRYSLCLAGFSGLPGFCTEAYSFSGISIPATAKFVYPSGYAVSASIDAIIDDPLSSYSYDGKTYEYTVRQGATEQGSYVSASGASAYILENMLDWPSRTFSIDLGRGMSRSCKGLEIWTEYSGFPEGTESSLFRLESQSNQNYKRAVFTENLAYWGPVFFGKRLKNSISGETLEFVHSIVRVYDYFNVFACFDAREKQYVNASGTWIKDGPQLAGSSGYDFSSVNWDGNYFNGYEWGCFKASMKSDFSKGGDMSEALESLMTTDIGSSTKALPLLNNFQTASSYYNSDEIQSYSMTGADDGYGSVYVIGYYDPGNGDGYEIWYSSLYQGHGLGNFSEENALNWRVIAASNTPWFKVGSGNKRVGDKAVTRVSKTADGKYNFNIIPYNSDYRQYANKYLDTQGNGYLYICPYWEGKEGRIRTGSKSLNPLSGYSLELTLVNGWYNPAIYQEGLPVLEEKTGMYFFPESVSANTRAGRPAYYTYDWPYINESFPRGYTGSGQFSPAGVINKKDFNILFGYLDQRDVDAGR